MLYSFDCKLDCNSIKKWMKSAKHFRDVENPCYSRSIGVIIVDPETNSIISSGHNGPPANCPPNDNPDYLRNVVWPQLTDKEREIAREQCDTAPCGYERSDVDEYVAKFGNCKICPRKPINAPSGKRLELCTCIHGEVDAICKAKASGAKLAGAYMFAYCGVPCIECTKVIINSCLKAVVCLDHGREDYSPYSSRWLFKNSRVKLQLVTEDWINS
jgi:deoxycytidylate deaminase